MTQVTKSELRGEQTCLKNCSANKFSIAIRFNLLQVCFLFLPPFEFAVLFIPFFMFEPVFYVPPSLESVPTKGILINLMTQFL